MMQEYCFGFKVTPDLACPLLPQWRSSLPRRCPGCPSWSRQASRSSRTCSTEGCPEFSAPLEGSVRCRQLARARCGEPPSTRRCRQSPVVECQSGEALLKVYSTKQQYFNTILQTQATLEFSHNFLLVCLKVVWMVIERHRLWKILQRNKWSSLHTMY